MLISDVLIKVQQHSSMDIETDRLSFDLKDVDVDLVDTLSSLTGMDNFGHDCDLTDLVDSIHNDKMQLFPSK